MGSIQAVLFDFDYTLADSSQGVIDCIGHALCELGLPAVSDEAACRTMVRFSRRHDPDAALADLYRTKDARYRKVLEAMAPVWADLAWKRG